MNGKLIHFPNAFFITGTDTGIGKTIVSAVLTRALRGTYFKPVQSGLMERTDTQTVRDLTELAPDHFFPETYKLQLPLSPHASAAHDGIAIDLDRFFLPPCAHAPLIVEGAGGVMVPLNERETMLDLMVRFQLPVLLVARSALGTINHTVLTLNALRSRQLTVLGVVMSGPLNQSNKEAIEHYGNTTVLAEIPPLAELTPAAIADAHKYFMRRSHDTDVSDLASVHTNENGRAAAAGRTR